MNSKLLVVCGIRNSRAMPWAAIVDFHCRCCALLLSNSYNQGICDNGWVPKSVLWVDILNSLLHTVNISRRTSNVVRFPTFANFLVSCRKQISLNSKLSTRGNYFRIPSPILEATILVLCATYIEFLSSCVRNYSRIPGTVLCTTVAEFHIAFRLFPSYFWKMKRNIIKF